MGTIVERGRRGSRGTGFFCGAPLFMGPATPSNNGIAGLSVTSLDATGLKCPLPVLRARKAMKGVAGGDILEVRATDPGAVADFKSFCETTGDELVEWREDAGERKSTRLNSSH